MATLFRHMNTAHTPARQEECFARLLAVGKLVLRRHGSREPRHCDRRSAVHLLRLRIQLAVQGRSRTLWDDAVSAFGLQPNRLPPSTLTASQSCRLALRDGAIGKAAHALASHSRLAESNISNLEKLEASTPDYPRIRYPDTSPSFQDTTFTEAEVRRALKSLPHFSAPGPDCFPTFHP